MNSLNTIVFNPISSFKMRILFLHILGVDLVCCIVLEQVEMGWISIDSNS